MINNKTNFNDSNEVVVLNFSKCRRNAAKSSGTDKKRYYLVLAKARKRYNMQHDKSSCSLYADCILDQIKETNGITEAEFKVHFTVAVMDLMDRMSFNLECQYRKLDPFVIATHLAAMPISQRKAILNNMDLLPEKVKNCGTPIFSLTELTEVDTYNVLTSEINIVAEKKK